MALVSAITGLNLLLGAGVGTVVGSLFGFQEAELAPLMLIGAGLGGAIGVHLGARVAFRNGGVSGAASERQITLWGLAGLVGSIALAALVSSPFTPILAIALPGLMAVLGDRTAAKREMAKRGTAPVKRKLREQEIEDGALDPPES